MRKAICSTCADYAMILRSLHANAPDQALACEFCRGQAGDPRFIEWQAKPRQLTVPALEMVPNRPKGIGLKAIADLARMESGATEKTTNTGPLIRAGLARMATGDKTEITTQGAEFLRILRLERFTL